MEEKKLTAIWKEPDSSELNVKIFNSKEDAINYLNSDSVWCPDGEYVPYILVFQDAVPFSGIVDKT